MIIDLLRRLYYDFSLAHAVEMLALHHDLHPSYALVHTLAKTAGLGGRRKRRPSKVRLQRERMSNQGLMLQMDGSHHDWNGRERWCLIALIDDATSEVVFARFFAGETTWACMSAMRTVIEQRGLPGYIYTDEAGWAGGGTKRPQFSQFGRAMDELGIGLIRTPIPQSKGRIERSFQTFQGRLIPEMRLYGIQSMADANRYLDQVFLPHWRERFAVFPSSPTSRWREMPPHLNLTEILCMKTSRRVGNDHVVNFETERYKIKTDTFGSLRRKEVTVHEYEDGGVGVFYGHIALEFERIMQPTRRWQRKVG